jgi:hypothetical protein
MSSIPGRKTLRFIAVRKEGGETTTYSAQRDK